MSSGGNADVFGSTSYLAPSGSSKARKSPSRGTLRGSPSSLANTMDTGGSPGRPSQFSLAHELAAALMPEPSAGSSLMDEFGIEYDEGAEGIDAEDNQAATVTETQDSVQTLDVPEGDPAFAQADPVFMHGSASLGIGMSRSTSLASELSDDPAFSEPDNSFGSPIPKRRTALETTRISSPISPTPPRDPIDILTRDLASTEAFLTHLRHIDATSSSTSTLTSSSIASSTVASSLSKSHTTPALEQAAEDIVRRINDAVRDREGQLRTLRECERELRKIGGEVGGDDVLASLDVLEGVDELHEELHPTTVPQRKPEVKKVPQDLPTVDEDDWEAQMENERILGDTDPDPDMDPDATDARGGRTTPTPVKDTFTGIPAPPPAGPPTPTAARAELAHLRALTGSLVSSLSTISEHAQVTGAATADAGRRIRALKHKMVGVQSDWDGAERSRVRIERWEAGAPDAPDGAPYSPLPATPSRSKRVDGRKLVAEHLRAFEAALTEAAGKTQLIMAAVA
jgi:hypothetical protein